MTSDQHLLLAAKTSTLETQRDFLKAAHMAWLARGEDKPGKSRKPKAFACLREFYKQNGQYPKIYPASKHLREEMKFSKAGADRYVKFYLLWERRSYVRLSQEDKRCLAKNVPETWKPFQRDEKIVEKGFASLRDAERELAQLRAARAPAITQTPTAPNPSRPTRPVTREWLIKKGFL